MGIFWIYFRHNAKNKLLEVFFKIKSDNIGHIIDICRQFIFEFFTEKETIKIPPRHIRDSYRVQFWNSWFIGSIDGVEQKIGKAKKFADKFYSSKTKQHSINTLIMIGMDNLIQWKGLSLGGYYNDLLMVEKNCLTNAHKNQSFIAQIHTDEHIFVDAGIGKPELNLIEPPAEKENPLYSYHSHYRIRIEVAFGQIKKYEACGGKMHGTKISNEEKLLKVHHQNWYIGASLYNLYYNSNYK